MHDLHQPHADTPRITYCHLAKTARNVVIFVRYTESETLSALAKDFGVSEQRAWRIIQRYRLQCLTLRAKARCISIW